MEFNNKGFTLVDIIIVGAIVSILVVLTYPLMTEFMGVKQEKEEFQVQQKILDTMHIYSLAENEIPISVSTTDLANAITGYGEVFRNEIERDRFRNEHYYRGVTTQEVFRDAVLDIHYAIVYSTGIDGCWSKDTKVDFECDPANIEINVSALLGNVPANYRANFNAIDVPEGDFMIKFTDFDQKHEAYKKTTKRMDKVVKVLGEYGRLKRFEGIAENVADSESLIYYPPSLGPAAALFYAPVLGDTSTETNQTDIYGAGGSDVLLNDDATVNDKDDRRLGMVALMRLLGLPDSYCCNAMKIYTDAGGIKHEEGLFYYSNPAPKVAGCTAPVAVTARKLPPRLAVDIDICGK